MKDENEFHFRITKGVIGDVGRPVKLTLTPESHWDNGKKSSPEKNVPINIPSGDFELGVIMDVNTAVDYAHQITIAPLRPNQTIVVQDNQRFFFPRRKVE